MRIGTALILAAWAASACATKGIPPDVSAFVERREMCDHFRGEVPDPEQVEAMRETIRQIDRYCTGTDAALAALKERYRDDAGVMNRLSRYEATIEGKATQGGR